MKPTLEEIQAAQLREYPDSKFVSIDEAFEWVNQDPSWFETEFARKKGELATYLNPDDARCEFSHYVEKLRLEHKNMILRGIAICLANAYEQGDVIQFYECGQQEDGAYRWKGCRYGAEGHEYYSGFSF